MEMDINRPVFCITGASGYIGKQLVRALVERGEVLIRTLSRNRDTTNSVHPDVSVIQGDLRKPETLASFLVPGCTVINLAYGFGASSSENLMAAKNLAWACRENLVKRLVHCSTVSVFGRVRDNVVNERSSCNPRTEYGVTKLLIEQILYAGSHGYYEYVNLRPTGVFGPGGAAMAGLIASLRKGSRILNYMRSSLFGNRKMNLVNLDTVTSAIIFLAMSDQKKVDGETFIISADDEPDNNFQYVENYLLNRLNIKDYLLPRIAVPSTLLSFILRVRGRDSDNPGRIFDPSKIRNTGFRNEMSLEDGLAKLVKWHLRKETSDPREGM